MEAKTPGIRISVILPNYNGEKYIEKAINSFLSQDYENKELIIVDGKSSDRSHSIIQKYISENTGIIWVKETDINTTDGFNIGLKSCSGDFISFLGSDVFYYTADIFTTINFNYGIVPFDCIYFDNYYYFAGRKQVRLNKCPKVDFTKENLLKYGTLAGFDNVFISRQVYDRHQLNPEYNLCSDWEFFLRITQDDLLFMYVEKVCAVDVQDGTNLSIKFSARQMEAVQKVGAMYNTNKIKLYFEAPETDWHKIKSGIKKFLKSAGRYNRTKDLN